MGCREILQLAFIVVSVVTSVASFVSTYWIVDNGYHEGLWTQCTTDKCKWILAEGFALQRHLPGTPLCFCYKM